MRLLHSNKINGATLTPSSENANYPASNLKDTRLSRKWRTTGDEDESLLIDAGGEALEVFQATDNLVTDPEDLTTGNWTPSNCDRVLSDFYYDGKRFTKLTNNGANTGFVYQSYTDTWATLTPSFSVKIKKGNSAGNTTQYLVQNTTTAGDAFNIIIDWDNYPNALGTPTDGVLHDYTWYDSETLELRIICATMDADTNDLRIICFGSNNTTDGEYTYWTAVQAEDLPYPTPYVNGSRAKNNPDETFEMPSQFTIDMIVKSWFVYDTAATKMVYSWYIDATHRCRIYYSAGSDIYFAEFHDGGTARFLQSQQFDNGTSHTNINQIIRIIVSIDLTTGDTTGSRLIVEPLESGAIAEDITWSGNIDILSSTFPTLSIGHENDVEQADSQFEYIRIYKGTLVGTVNNSADADALLAEKELILDKTYLEKITASYALIAGHNISAGASIKLQGNDYNSWNGPPLEEDMTWDSETIVHALTEVSYPFWRLLIDDPNNTDGIIKIGRPYLGTFYQVEKTFNKEFTEETFNTDIASYSQSGQLYTRRGYDGKQYNLNFPYWENSVKQAIEDIMATIGKRNPLFLILDEDNIDVLPVLYCHIPSDSQYPHIVDYRWKASLSFREVF